MNEILKDNNTTSNTHSEANTSFRTSTIVSKLGLRLDSTARAEETRSASLMSI